MGTSRLVLTPALWGGAMVTMAIAIGYGYGVATFHPNQSLPGIMPEVGRQTVPAQTMDLPDPARSAAVSGDASQETLPQASPLPATVVITIASAASPALASSTDATLSAAQSTLGPQHAIPATMTLPPRVHVQVGSFEDRASAEALLNSLRARGYATHLVEGASYRVWVGRYLDQAAAERLSATLGHEGLEATLVSGEE